MGEGERVKKNLKERKKSERVKERREGTTDREKEETVKKSLRKERERETDRKRGEQLGWRNVWEVEGRYGISLISPSRNS